MEDDDEVEEEEEEVVAAEFQSWLARLASGVSGSPWPWVKSPGKLFAVSPCSATGVPYSRFDARGLSKILGVDEEEVDLNQMYVGRELGLCKNLAAQ